MDTYGKKKPTSKSQIDFLMVSAGVTGPARAHSMPTKTFQKFDRRVVGRFVMDRALGGPFPSQDSLKGWRPACDAAAEVFKRRCLDHRGSDVKTLQDGVKQCVLQVKFDTSAPRKRGEREARNQTVNSARRLVATSSTEHRRAAVKKLRQGKKKTRT